MVVKATDAKRKRAKAVTTLPSAPPGTPTELNDIVATILRGRDSDPERVANGVRAVAEDVLDLLREERQSRPRAAVKDALSRISKNARQLSIDIKSLQTYEEMFLVVEVNNLSRKNILVANGDSPTGIGSARNPNFKLDDAAQVRALVEWKGRNDLHPLALLALASERSVAAVERRVRSGPGSANFVQRLVCKSEELTVNW
jgi:hypothetical protein